MSKHIANIITACRIVCSTILLFLSAFSPAFFAVYLLCGLTDMVDGTVARKTNSVTPFGSGRDTVADAVFLTAAAVKLLPAMNIPRWLWWGIAIIAVIKTISLLCGRVRTKRWGFEHTAMNKVTGLLLFLLPLTVSFIELRYSANAVCAVALFSAIQEGYYTLTERVG